MEYKLQKIVSHMLSAGYSQSQIHDYLHRRQVTDHHRQRAIVDAAKNTAARQAAHSKNLDFMSEGKSPITSIVLGTAASILGLAVAGGCLYLLIESDSVTGGIVGLVLGGSILYNGVSTFFMGLGDLKGNVDKKIKRMQKTVLVPITSLKKECISCESFGFTTKSERTAGGIIEHEVPCLQCHGLGLI